MDVVFFYPSVTSNSLINDIGKEFNIEKSSTFKYLLKTQKLVILFNNYKNNWAVKILKFRLQKKLRIYVINENEKSDILIDSIKKNKKYFFSENINKKFISIKNIFENKNKYEKNITNNQKLLVYADKNIEKNIKINNKIGLLNNEANSDVIVFDKISESYNIKNLKKYILCKKDDYIINILGNNYPGYYKDFNELNEILDYLYYKKIKNETFYFDFMERKKVLFISNDIIWNSYCGNSVWATNFIKILKKRNNIDFDVAICRKMRSIDADNIFENELSFCNFINLIKNKKDIRSSNNNTLMKEASIIKYINNNVSQYDYIILRGYTFITRYFKSFSSLSKSKMIYVQMHKEKTSPNLKNLKRIHMTFLDYFNRMNEKDAYIIPPLIDEKITINNNKIYDFCYVGTFHEDSCINEICEYFSDQPDLKINFTGKILPVFENKFLTIKEKYLNKKNIIFNISKLGIEKSICDKVIQQSKIGIRIDDLYECLSSKVLTYINYEIPVILQRTTTHEKILGVDYPFFLPRNKNVTSKDFENLLSKKVDLDNVISKIKETKKILDPDTLIKNNYKLLI